jgi:anthranilate phosphoribosyltransferase
MATAPQDAPDLDLRQALRDLAGGTPLSRPDAAALFSQVMTGHATDAQVGSLLTALAVRSGGPTVDEITGAAAAMRAQLRPIRVPDSVDRARLIDTCGTGGDHAATFNISTTAALIAAAAGAFVAKHGNRAVTSASGSSQVLEALGVKIDGCDDALLSRCLAEVRVCFCFAPAHHPAMKHVAAARQQLGFRTIFNMLGPLTNPAGAKRQLIGVYAPHLTETFAQVLQNLGSESAMIVHGYGELGALDELTTTGQTRITTLCDGHISTTDFSPEELGLPRTTFEALRVTSAEQSAKVVRDVLSGVKGPPRDIAALNAAAALVVADLAQDLREGLKMAEKALDSGAGLATLIRLTQITNGL